jgi:putative membrane protein
MIALTAVALLALAGLYWRGVERLWRRAGRGAAGGPRQTAAFAPGLALVGVAVLPPLDPLAHERLAAHMVQHLLLVMVAPPLLVLGAPLNPLLWGTPWRRRLHRLKMPRRVRRAVARPGWTLVAAVVHVAVLWAWHVPLAYEAALRSTLVHAAEHATMLGTAVALWVGVVTTHGPRRQAHPVGALALFLVATLTVGLGTLLVFSPRVWYPTYEAAAAARGTSALDDQHLAGALMWTFGGIGAMALGSLLIGVWLARSNPGGPNPVPGGRVEQADAG